jgi:hypothetical protein
MMAWIPRGYSPAPEEMMDLGFVLEKYGKALLDYTFKRTAGNWREGRPEWAAP